MTEPLNERIAEHLREAADLLENKGANPFRVNAYRRAADTLHGLDRDIGELAERGDLKALTALPGALAAASPPPCTPTRPGPMN